MKKSSIIITISIIILLMILFCVVVFAEGNKNELNLEDKVSQEISYLDRQIVSILGNFNGLTTGTNLKEDNSKKLDNSNKQNSQQLNNNNQESQNSNTQNINSSNQNNVLSSQGKYSTNWDMIQNQIEDLYQTWNTVTIDLYSLNKVDKTIILAFSDILNSSTQNIKNKDKQKSIEEVIKLYQLLPQYSQSYRQNSKETNILKIKSNIITAYAYATNEKWQEAETQLSEAEKQFASLLNSVNQEFKNQTSANQCYILVNELIKSVRLKDKDIFFIEYQNLMEKMETI